MDTHLFQCLVLALSNSRKTWCAKAQTETKNKNGSSAIPTFRMQAKKESCHQTKGGKAQCQLKSAQTNAFLIITGGRDPNPAGNGSLTPSVSSSLRLQHTFVGVKKEVGGSETGENRRKWLLSRACTSEWARPKSQKKHHIRIEALPPVRARGLHRNDHLWGPAADCKQPCIPLRSASYVSSSMVKGPS